MLGIERTSMLKSGKAKDYKFKLKRSRKGYGDSGELAIRLANLIIETGRAAEKREVPACDQNGPKIPTLK